MIDSVLLIALVSLIALAVVRGKPSFLPILVTFEFAANQLIDEVLVAIGLFSFENISTIILIRFVVSSIAALAILKYRKGMNWVSVGILYAIILLFQFATFVESSFSAGFLVSNYSLVIQTLSALIVLALVVNQCGISNWLRPVLLRYHATFPSTDRNRKGIE